MDGDGVECGGFEVGGGGGMGLEGGKEERAALGCEANGRNKQQQQQQPGAQEQHEPELSSPPLGYHWGTLDGRQGMGRDMVCAHPHLHLGSHPSWRGVSGGACDEACDEMGPAAPTLLWGTTMPGQGSTCR